eukprot:8419231-Alexandrium_andersonii.AAC.1
MANACARVEHLEMAPAGSGGSDARQLALFSQLDVANRRAPLSFQEMSTKDKRFTVVKEIAK